jgi:hypothetical protein
MLDHETGDEEEVTVKIVLVEIFEGGEYIKYLLASPSLRKEGTTFCALFWHLITLLFLAFAKGNRHPIIA